MVEIFFHAAGKTPQINVASLISIKSRNIALAVSIPPAPLPIIVCCPECSEENVTAFRVPLTHIGSVLATSVGAT
jgi:hypothetical protein